MKLHMLHSFVSKARFHLWTLVLFTKSDIKTTVIPVTSLAVASAPLASWSNLLHVIFWVWLHVLQFDVSNQTLRPEEDELNKKDRPLPAKRISRHHALIMRWALVPICLALSAAYSTQTIYASIALCALTFIYDELGFASGHWSTRNIINSLGFVSFEVGACLVAGKDRTTMDKICILSILCSAGIFASTIQAQDFKDTAGDRLIGRQTLPIVAPSTARPALALILILWSRSLCAVWDVCAGGAMCFNILGLMVGFSFMLFDSVKADQRSFYLYNVWLSAAHVLPAYYRYVAMVADY